MRMDSRDGIAKGICRCLAAWAAAGEGLSLEDGFRSPPDTAKPHLWWHWMNGKVTKEGITADLESMAAVGIGGAQIFDAGCGIPPGPVAFGPPAWYETFAHAAKEAFTGEPTSGGRWTVTPSSSCRRTTSCRWR